MTIECSCPRHVCTSAVNRPVYEVEKDVGSWKDHTRVHVNDMCVLDYAEVAQALLLGGRGGIADRQMHHHVLMFLNLLRHHRSISVAGQAVGVHLAACPIQHHGPGVGQATCAGQRLKQGGHGEISSQTVSYTCTPNRRNSHWWCYSVTR